jgi:malate dehydrogenase (quinone)
MAYATHIENPDVVLIGSGVMSANLGAMLKTLDPTLSIQVYEVTDELAQESSHGWNNAGTGHAGLCELSYTPTREADGTVNVANAVKVFEQFEYSRQFWSYAVAAGMIDRPREFINQVAHISFVHGAEMVDFLKARHAAMSAHHFFSEMEYTTDRATIANWAPLLVEGRDREVPVAATRTPYGTDVNFGVLSRKLLSWLSAQDRCGIASGHRVVGLKKIDTGWQLRIKNLKTGEVITNRGKFVFVGAGGGSLPLLQKAHIAEAKGLGGFPIGGQWLVCDNPEVVARHQAKVYGQPQPEAPTMAVPHLDTRVLDGKKTLLFGPFAAFTTKFLHKKGSITDLPRSVKFDNLATLINIGLSNLDLVGYLIREGTQSMATRMKILRRFYPEAREQDWNLIDAGIRVQAIKKSDGKAGIVHYGTEVITSADRSIAALLGASPGASVCVSIVLDVIKTCLPGLLSTPEGQARVSAMLPMFGLDLKVTANADRFRQSSDAASRVLGLD